MKTPHAPHTRPALRRMLLAAILVIATGVLVTFAAPGVNRDLPPLARAAAFSVRPYPQPCGPEAAPAASGDTARDAQNSPLSGIRPVDAPISGMPAEDAAPHAEAGSEADREPAGGPDPADYGPHAPSWEPLLERLVADGFDAMAITPLFASLGSPPLPEFMGQKVVELYSRYGKASLNITGEERAKFAPPDYTRIAGGMSVAAGRKVMNANRKFFEGLYKRYGVPAPFIIAVLMVETGLGAELGKQSALLALGSMAVTDSLEQVLPVVSGIDKNHDNMRELIKARSDWAYTELKALIDYARAAEKDAATIPGSVYGAIGICQFMPSNIPLFAVSTNKERSTPDLFILPDAAASVARYLSAHGWRKATTPAAQIAVLRSYNHSDVYASTVYGVASALISPTTHQSAESARKGGSAVRAARENAKASLPEGTKKAKPMKNLHNYFDLLQ